MCNCSDNHKDNIYRIHTRESERSKSENIITNNQQNTKESVQKRGIKGQKATRHKENNNEMAKVNLSLAVIILNVNELSSPVKGYKPVDLTKTNKQQQQKNSILLNVVHKRFTSNVRTHTG